MSCPIPENEVERLHTLRGYELLDTHPEERFDELTRLAASICGTPISLISLVDENRQWFKSRTGLEVCPTLREDAFCAHAILSPELFVVPDASQDPRFASNPLVLGESHIRFYAGAPLIAPNGHCLGALCVMDRRPRQLSREQMESLRILSRQVMAQVVLGKNLHDLKTALKAREDVERDMEKLIQDLHADRATINTLKDPVPTNGGTAAVVEPPPPQDKGSLLVVDDRFGPRQSLWIIFKDEYNLLMAEDGPTAIELAKQHPVDVAVLDICMPGMSGIEVLKRLKDVSPSTEVIMMTAFETMETVRQALRLRACDYISKPFDVATMRNAVGQAMLRRQTGR
jgi:CheY-like chemotaxis protein